MPETVEVPPFRQVFDAHAPFVWRVLRRLGVPASDVADLSQETFVVVHRRLGTFEGRSSLRTWIYGICVRVAADWRKRAHVRREHPVDEHPEPPPTGDGPADELERRRALALVDRALAGLSPERREAFVLYELEELTLAEVAEVVGAPLQTVHSRLQAARAHVQAVLNAAERPNPQRSRP